MRVIIVGVCAAVCASCSSDLPPASDKRQVVVFATDRPEDVEAVRQRLQPSQTAAVDAQGTQMWSVDDADVSALRALQAQGRVARLHVEQNNTWPVLREIGPSEGYATAIRNVIGFAPPTSYIVGRLAREVPLSAALTSGFRLSVPLPGGGEIELARPRQMDSRTWQFDIDGGVAAISTDESGLRGTIQTPRGVFLIRPLSNGAHVVYEPQRPSVPDEPPHTPPKRVPNPEALDVAPPPPAACADDTLRILPLYTSQVEAELAKLKVGTVDVIASDAERDTGVAITKNQLGVQIDVLTPLKVTFNHANDLLSEVASLTARSNRPSDEIGKLRASASADVVMLFSTAGKACGAVLPEILDGKIARPNQAYFVLATPLIRECVFTFAHELSHVLGMRHHDDKTSAAEPLAYGFCDAANTFSTITATYASCNGRRQLLWSDPNETVQDSQGKALPAGDKVRHWEAAVLPKQFKAAAAFHCAAPG